MTEKLHRHCCCCSGEEHEQEHQHEQEHEHEHDHQHEHEHGHEHHHHHHEHGGLKGKLWLIIATTLLLIGAVAVEKCCGLATWQLLLVYLVPYLLIGHDTLKEAAEGVVKGEMFNEDFLMTIATLGALTIGFLPGAETEFAEAVFVMLFFQVGELFEGYAEGNSKRSISHLMAIRPDTAEVKRGDKVLTVAPDEVKVGETIVVAPGAKVALDGVVTKGSSALNTMALTGESAPRDVTVGDTVASGCVNLTGVLEMRTTRCFGESTVSKIISLVESADKNKSRSEAFITRFARVYTPIVVFMALALAFLPPLFATGGYADGFATWLHRALIFLVVSCPCALVISVPLTFFGGIGGASRHGILVKGSNYIDALADIGTVVFDKTGTLTYGQFEVEAVHPDHYDKEQLLHLAAHVEHYTTHPIGAALRNAFPNEACDGCRVEQVEEIAGQGVRAVVNGHTVCVGNTKMMDALSARWHDCHHAGTIIHVAVDGVYAGHIVVNDKIKEDSAKTIADLKALGVEHTVMLTGDREAVGKEVAERLGIDEWHAELMPTDKVAHIERLLGEEAQGEGAQLKNAQGKSYQGKRAHGKSVAFVGDGINDAPVLKRADVGIAMGALGCDAAIEAADVVLMDDKPSNIAVAIKIARHTIAIARQNVWFAIGVKVAVLLLATVGLGNMWMAVMADVGVTVVAVLNAMRSYLKANAF